MLKYFKIYLLISSTLIVSGNANANLLTNGDFESGDTGFLSNYTSNGTNLFDPQVYSIVTDPNLVHSSAISYGDNTTGTGLMMAVNGSTSSDALLWSQELLTDINTAYNFSAFTSSWTPGAPASVKLVVNGIEIGTFDAPSTIGIWEENSFNFNSGSNTSLDIELFTQSTAYSGNDFALDDLSLISTLASPVPLPPAFLLFLSGLFGLFTFKKNT